MALSIIAYTEQDANKIARHFEMPVRWMLRQRSLTASYPLEHGVYYIRDGATPKDQLITMVQVRKKWPKAYIQYVDVGNTNYFIKLMEPVVLRRKVRQKRIARRWMARYPGLTFDLTVTDYNVFLSVVLAPNWRGGVPLHDFFLARKRLREYSFGTIWHRIFDWALPNLHVRVLGNEDNGYTAHAWVRRDGRCGESTFWKASFPLTDEDWIALHKLDRRVGPALRDGWFFCSRCQTAKPRSEFGHSLYAENRCQDCMTPDFLRAARTENHD